MYQSFNPLISGATKKTKAVSVTYMNRKFKFQSPDKRGNEEDKSRISYLHEPQVQVSIP